MFFFIFNELLVSRQTSRELDLGNLNIGVGPGCGSKNTHKRSKYFVGPPQNAVCELCVRSEPNKTFECVVEYVNCAQVAKLVDS